MQQLFALTFRPDSQEISVPGVTDHLTDIDAKIQTAAPEWPLAKIAKIDLVILRLSVYELIYEKNTPPKVVIDEAVELAKEFGNVNSPQFVNGVLGTILKDI
jgi:transcription antitermination protein NusB